jgi:serine protease Do
MLVQSIQKGSGADKAGIKAGQTKVIVGGVSTRSAATSSSVDGKPTTTYEQLRDAVSQQKPGDKVKLEIYRNGSKKSVTVTLGKDTR